MRKDIGLTRLLRMLGSSQRHEDIFEAWIGLTDFIGRQAQVACRIRLFHQGMNGLTKNGGFSHARMLPQM